MSTPENPPPQQQLPANTTAPTGALSKNEQNLGMLCHLLALSGYLVPFGHIAGPLILWMLKRQEIPFVDSEGKESINFQISVSIYGIIAFLLIFVLIGFVLLPAVLLFNLIFVIIASIEAANGKSYRYPLCIRFLK